jgi:hypothetical protein
MKRTLLFLTLLLPFCSNAQWFDISAMGGIAPYKISAGIKNSVAATYYGSLSFVKLKKFDLGVQVSGMNTITVCSTLMAGIFADYVINIGDEEKHIITLGVHYNNIYYGDIPKGGQYFKDGSRDTTGLKMTYTDAYGIRLGYKHKLNRHFYADLLISPTYSISPIHFGSVKTLNCALFTIPVTVGISLRL